MAEYPKPIPEPDEKSAPWFAGTTRHELLLQHCRTCDGYQWPVWEHCNACWATDLEWAPSKGQGTVFTWALMHQIIDPAFAAEAPYNVAVVELDEGPRLNTQIAAAAPGEIRVGLRVEVDWDDIAPHVSLPRFRPVRA